MGNYLLLYHGGTQPSTPEEGAEVMTAWTNWFTTLAGAVVDPGNPTSTTKTISPSGSVDESGSAVNGYSVVSAESFDQAVGLATSCPHRTFGGSIEVVQVDPIM